MKTTTVSGAICILCLASCMTTANAQTNRKSRFMKENDLILFNVAAKGRVVELLANEIARTEIIRALLYEYAKECVQNITVLEKSCLTCMTERCQNRLAECEIKSVRLSEIISHDPSPIEGLQFLRQAPKRVTADLKDFADNAMADILRDVPEELREKSEKIVHTEVDQSLAELKENMDTEKTLQTITIHFQKVANNVHLLPDLGEKLATLIVENGDRAVNIADLLAKKLHSSRPYVDSMAYNGGKVKEQAPGILTKLGDTLSAFKNRVVGVFNSALDTFQQVLNDPDTIVEQEIMYPDNQQQAFSSVNMAAGSVGQPFRNRAPNGPFLGRGQVARAQFQSDFGPIDQRQSFLQNPDAARRLLRKLEFQVESQLQGLHSNQQQGWFSGGAPMNQNQHFLQQQSQIHNPIPPFIPVQGPQLVMQGQNFASVINGQSQQQIGQGQTAGQLTQQQLSQGQMTGQMQIPQQQLGQGQIPESFPQQQMGTNMQSPTQFPQNQQMQQPLSQSPQNQPASPQRNAPVGIGTGPSGIQLAQNQQARNQPTPQGQLANTQFVAGQRTVGAPQSQQLQVQPTSQGQQRGQLAQGQRQPTSPGRKRRQAQPDCDKLRYDPETYCKTYESQCHNCTLEKRLRFEVCGEGVEKARDEIKRLDKSVQNYLEAYDDHIASGPLVLKVELNDTNRLAKTNTYYNAYITAKIGASIFRYKTKMNLNINDLRISGSQIGDEIWEKLWDEKVFEEAQRLETVEHEHADMGQLHKFNVKLDTKKTQAHKSSAGSAFTLLSSVLVSLACAVVFLL